MMITAIKNATLIMRDHYIPDAVLLLKDGKILDYGEARKLPIPQGAEIIGHLALVLLCAYLAYAVHALVCIPYPPSCSPA